MINLKESQLAIKEVCTNICDLLIDKNKKYGNSALSPINIFSQKSAQEQILVRIDDKLNRIKNIGIDPQNDEDTILDLVGYLVLLLVWRKLTQYNKEQTQ